MLIGPRGVRTAAAIVAALIAIPAMMHADEATRRETEQWRSQHEIDYRRDYVPLAGLYALKPGPNSAGSAASNDLVLPSSVPAVIGRFHLDGRIVRFEPQQGAGVMLDGKPVTGGLTLRSDAAETVDELAIGDVSLWVHISGERPTIRMRDPDGEPARTFRGFEWFTIDDSYRVTGRFIKDPAPREVRAPNQLGDEDVMQTEGVVEFSLHGRTVRLRPMTTRPNRFWFIFRDATSGKETYETARFLYADLQPDGTAVLDFNRAYNPPCAFNPYTTCPIPLPENRLTIPILAGEKDYAP